MGIRVSPIACARMRANEKGVERDDAPGTRARTALSAGDGGEPGCRPG